MHIIISFAAKVVFDGLQQNLFTTAFCEVLWNLCSFHFQNNYIICYQNFGESDNDTNLS